MYRWWVLQSIRSTKIKTHIKHLCCVNGKKEWWPWIRRTSFYARLKKINEDEDFCFYHVGRTKPQKLRVHLIANLCDIPERYARCGITRGNGNNTSRWRYLSDANILKKYLAPCKDCFEKIKNHINEHSSFRFLSKCNVCTAWSMDNECLLNLQIPSRLSDYSTEMAVHSTLNTRYIKSFEELKNAAKFCYRHVKVGEWTPAQGAAYLTLYEINRKW